MQNQNVQVNFKPILVQIMAWRRICDNYYLNQWGFGVGGYICVNMSRWVKLRRFMQVSSFNIHVFSSFSRLQLCYSHIHILISRYINARIVCANSSTRPKNDLCGTTAYGNNVESGKSESCPEASCRVYRANHPTIYLRSEAEYVRVFVVIKPKSNS